MGAMETEGEREKELSGGKDRGKWSKGTKRKERKVQETTGEGREKSDLLKFHFSTSHPSS